MTGKAVSPTYKEFASNGLKAAPMTVPEARFSVLAGIMPADRPILYLQDLVITVPLNPLNSIDKV